MPMAVDGKAYRHPPTLNSAFLPSQRPRAKKKRHGGSRASLPVFMCLRCGGLVAHSIQERPQLSRARWMPQFPQRFRLDLTNALASYGKRLTYFFESVFRAVFQTKAHLDDLLFARCQCAQHLRSLVFQVDIDHGFGRRDDGAVFDEVAQMRI